MFKSLYRYGLTTVLNYLIIIFGTIVLVEWLKLDPRLAYFFIISLVYLLTYIIYSQYVFQANFSRKILIKFMLALGFFWLLNNLFFNLLVAWLAWRYLVAVFFNIVFLGAIRFIVYKNFVFTNR